jgi:hypothetical protein
MAAGGLGKTCTEKRSMGSTMSGQVCRFEMNFVPTDTGTQETLGKISEHIYRYWPQKPVFKLKNEQKTSDQIYVRQ